MRNTHGFHRVIKAQRLVASLAVFLGMSVAGCGGSSPEPAPATAANSVGQAAPANDGKPVKTGDKTKPGQKSVGGIPYDVFFDKPLAIAANNQTAAPKTAVVANNDSAAPPKMSSNGPSETTPAEPPPKTASSGGAAAMLMEKEALLNEIKNVRNYLAGKVASQATYNSSILEMPPEAATLAMLAIAASKLPDDFSWKKNAKHVRDLAGKIAELTASKDAKTKITFEQISDAFAKIDDVLKGSPPADLAEADEEKEYGDVIAGSVVPLMKRIKKSEETLKANVSSEAGLKKEAERVAQEGAVLAFLAEVIRTPGFGFDGDAEFTAAAKPLLDGGKELIEASKSGDYAGYDKAMSGIGKSCTECHNKFKP